jgi:hypothetical protein
MASNKYTTSWFIKKFKSIPEDKWTTVTFKNNNGQCCALGHLGCHVGIVGDWPEPATKLKNLFRERLGLSVIFVNDRVNEFGKTPRQRILNALKKIQRKVRKHTTHKNRTAAKRKAA